MDFKKLLKLGGGEVFGLDVGSSAVKIVQLERGNNGFTAVAAGKMNISVDDESEIARDIQTVCSISDCSKISRVKSRYAVCGQCGPDTAVRYFKFPILPEDEIPSAVALEGQQVCPFTVDENYFDYQLIPDGSDSLRGVLVASTGKSIKHKEKLVRDASLVPVLMDVDGLALVNCLSECVGFKDGHALAVLNVGHTYSTLVIAGEHTVPFVRDINHAGEKIIGILSRKTGLDKNKILEMLLAEEVTEKKSLLLESGLEDACKVLIDDVTGTLRYYGAQKKTVQIDTLHVCGGFSMAKSFIEILNNNLPVEVVLWNPFDKIELKQNCPGEELLKNQGPALAVATGLAMRSI